jgi:hypothetical protein
VVCVLVNGVPLALGGCLPPPPHTHPNPMCVRAHPLCTIKPVATWGPHRPAASTHT